MTLLIDIGNTRVKWAHLSGQRLGEQYAATHAEWSLEFLRQHWLPGLSKPTRVLVANVAGDYIAAMLRTAIQDVWNITPQFVRSSVSAVGVRNAYRVPEQLGVDRWLGVIGAHHLERRAACVASVGTALTIDGVDADGQHLGGIIIPGPELMTQSLFRNTSDIAERARQGDFGQDLFADNTQAAVYQGITYALAATIERAVQEMQARIHVLPALILTGGASNRLTSALRVPFRTVPDLVLRGLAELAREGA